MRKEISDIFLLLYLVPAAGFVLSLPITIFTEKGGIGKKKYGYLYMKMILFFHIVMPMIMLITFMENRKVGYIWIGGDFDYMRTYKNSALYYEYLEREEFWSLNVFFLIWLIGGLLLFAAKNLHGNLQLKWLKEVSVLQAEEKFASVKKRAIERLGIQKEIPIYQSDLLNTSFLAGIRKPAIFLPQKEFSEDELYCILRHELIHYKHRDLWYRRLMLFIRGFYWINPLIYLFYKSFLDSCEFACDEAVLEQQEKNVKICYAKTIYRFTVSDSAMKNVVGFGSKNMCERRIRAIMNMNKVQKKGFVLLLTGVMLFLFPMVSYASVESAVQVQTKLGRVLKQKYNPAIEVEWHFNFVEVTTPTPDDSEMVVVQNLEGMARGKTNINCTVNGRYIVGTLELTKGDQVMFRIMSENDTDQFSAGLANDGLDNTVSSEGGIISHTFTIKKTGSYDIFITSDKAVSITGSVTVQ